MKKTYVYFVAAPGRIKIGFTTQPEGRLAGLQAADMEPLSMLAIISGTRRLERHLHILASKYRLRKEWFEDCPAVRAIVDRAISGDVQAQEGPSAEMSESRQQAKAIFDYELRNHGSRMAAYGAVAESVGISSHWVRHFIHGYDATLEIKASVANKIREQFLKISASEKPAQEFVCGQWF